MPRISRELSAVEIRNLKRPGYHCVGGVAGLILQVTGSGAKSWVLSGSAGGVRREFGLGFYPSVSLAQAREAARLMRAKIAAGVDPVEERAAAKRALAAQRVTATMSGHHLVWQPQLQRPCESLGGHIGKWAKSPTNNPHKGRSGPLGLSLRHAKEPHC